MDPSTEHPIVRFEGGKSSSEGDMVITEARIELDINDGQMRPAILCLPEDLEALAVGFMHGEGALKCLEDLKKVEYLPGDRTVIIQGDFDEEILDKMSLRWTLGTGCGGGGTSQLTDASTHKPVGTGRVVTPEQLFTLVKDFTGRTGLWRKTGGVHACALCSDEQIILFAEDVGRHNAFDKIMGKAFLEGIDVTDKLVLTTGRISGEIVSKAISCGVTMLCSRSAVTSLAVRLGRRFGVTLAGFLRGHRMNVYTGYQRIVTRTDLTEKS